MRLAAACCALTLGAVGLAGCGGDSSGDAAATTAATTAATGAGAPAPAPLALSQRVPAPGDLAGFTVDETRIVDAAGLLDEISESDERDDDRASLEAAGFRRAALQTYESGADGYAVAFAIEVSAAGAPGLVEEMHTDSLDTGDPEVRASDVVVEGIPGARALSVAGTTEGIPVVGTFVMFADGPVVYGIQAARQGSEPVEAQVLAAGVALHRRVAGAPPAEDEPAVTRTAPAGTAPRAAFPDEGERALLAHVPAPSRVDCERTSETGRAGDATSSVRCSPEGLIVYYEQFGSAEDATGSYESYVTANGLSRGEGTTCDRDVPSEGSWNGDENRVVCWKNPDGSAWMAWSHAALEIVSVAVDRDGDMDRLFSWWESPRSGPVS